MRGKTTFMQGRRSGECIRLRHEYIRETGQAGKNNLIGADLLPFLQGEDIVITQYLNISTNREKQWRFI